jgi:UDP-glucose 4-epimerase
MARYLVTGGGGFIGSYIARRLLGRGDEVVALDNLSTGQAVNYPPGADVVHGDISRVDTMKLIPGGRYDAVLHLAAQSSGQISHEEPGLDLNTNALGTLLLLDWCQQNQVPRFLYASSMAIYGLTDKVPVHESQTLDPYSFYGISKQAGEQYVRHFAKHGLATTILRMFNVYGPAQNMANMKQGMVSIYLAFLAKGEPVLVLGSLDRFRDFVYIDDVVEGWLAALDNPKSHGQVYNLANGRKTLVRELLIELLRAWGHDPENFPIQQGDGTPGDQFGIYADTTAITTDLGWQPKVDLPEGLKIMADWTKAQLSPQNR